MAKCEKNVVLVTKPVEETQYVLTLSQEEAELIKSFLGICAGKYGVNTGVFEALHTAGVRARELQVNAELTDHHENVLEYIYLVGLGDYV